MYPTYIWPSRQNGESMNRTIVVTGNGEVVVEPNMAVVQLSVITESESLSQAQQQNSEIMTKVIQALDEAGIPSEQIQTISYTVEPMYDYVEGKQIFRGYEVTNTISVQIKQLEKTGYLIDLAVQNGVNRVSNVQFQVDNSEKFEEQALSNALKDAVTKAGVLGQTMNTTISSIPIRIKEFRSEGPVLYKTMAFSQAQTPIEPGQIIIQAALEATFNY
ncbi:SIMPL domain-containing protein [Virgibacillus halodenitrificans]|nr:SIMPL domain-containing protein [Virgibacillus halodenitrificans]